MHASFPFSTGLSFGFIFQDFANFRRAHSRLYQYEILQENMVFFVVRIKKEEKNTIRFSQFSFLVRLIASVRLIELRPFVFWSFLPAAAHECSAPPPGTA